MSRYIDANALKMDLYSIAKADYGYTADVLTGLTIAERAIDSAPTVDAVEVVRCRDCKHTTYDAEYGNRWCNRNSGCRNVKDDGFCDDGERRTGNG